MSVLMKTPVMQYSASYPVGSSSPSHFDYTLVPLSTYFNRYRQVIEETLYQIIELTSTVARPTLQASFRMFIQPGTMVNCSTEL